MNLIVHTNDLNALNIQIPPRNPDTVKRCCHYRKLKESLSQDSVLSIVERAKLNETPVSSNAYEPMDREYLFSPESNESDHAIKTFVSTSATTPFAKTSEDSIKKGFAFPSSPITVDLPAIIQSNILDSTSTGEPIAIMQAYVSPVSPEKLDLQVKLPSSHMASTGSGESNATRRGYAFPASPSTNDLHAILSACQTGSTSSITLNATRSTLVFPASPETLEAHQHASESSLNSILKPVSPDPDHPLASQSCHTTPTCYTIPENSGGVDEGIPEDFEDIDEEALDFISEYFKRLKEKQNYKKMLALFKKVEEAEKLYVDKDESDFKEPNEKIVLGENMSEYVKEKIKEIEKVNIFEKPPKELSEQLRYYKSHRTDYKPFDEEDPEILIQLNALQDPIRHILAQINRRKK